MPASAQAFISFAEMGREASEISVSPRQNFLKPPPVPEMPTVTLMAPRFIFWNSSATASEIGYTVLEPSILTMSACAFAAASRPPANNAGIAKLLKRLIEMAPCRGGTFLQPAQSMGRVIQPSDGRLC